MPCPCSDRSAGRVKGLRPGGGDRAKKPPGGSDNLAEILAAHGGIGPGFHFLRHALSVAILAHHCRVAVIGGASPAQAALENGAAAGVTTALGHGKVLGGFLQPGLFALVGLFFALSGFLIAGSALRTGRVGPFLANRCLRIVPALTVEVTLSALVLGPFFTTLPLNQYFADPMLLNYFGNIVGHVALELPGVFQNNPWPSIVNANLWTLPPEFWCYLIMLGLMLSGVLATPARFTLAVAGISAVALGLGLYDPARFTVRHDNTHFATWYIVLMFFFGAAMFLNARRVIVSFPLFLACGTLYYVLMLGDVLGVVSGMLLTYCMVYVGMQGFAWFDRVVKKDLSYGIYLYGFPLTQATVAVLIPHLGGVSKGLAYAVIFPLVLVLTGSFASLSWDYIERPALRLRRLLVRGPRPRAAIA
ncbi:acyltransferase [Methylobacterium mesophilicum SR1.6/6]|uniref:Acyltransferase n=1 Tax=Methylobacterium mesophilicum SR1.6/6 TaxID=908290 RepID=A0A6B9FS19_9HYPH|nr:acyltransferase [Methylobacterium mesophilicum]QGY03794.1 acyltransferase [Methylobacterium mesophilicum SR1.6/6]